MESAEAQGPDKEAASPLEIYHVHGNSVEPPTTYDTPFLVWDDQNSRYYTHPSLETYFVHGKQVDGPYYYSLIYPISAYPPAEPEPPAVPKRQVPETQSSGVGGLLLIAAAVAILGVGIETVDDIQQYNPANPPHAKVYDPFSWAAAPITVYYERSKQSSPYYRP